MYKKALIITTLLAVGLTTAVIIVWPRPQNLAGSEESCSLAAGQCGQVPATDAHQPDSATVSTNTDINIGNNVSVVLKPSVADPDNIAPLPVSTAPSTEAVIELPRPASSTDQYVFFNVPFLSQAPFADWQDPRQQDGCEEATAIMAMHWVKGTPVTKEKGLEEILALAKYEEDTYGSFHDTSAADTVERIFHDYYGYDQVSARENITLRDIKAELEKGHLVITPMNGRALGNPNYTAPGPERHMIVIKGYDPEMREFITNDPGTRKGEGYRYPENVFFAAIRDYSTGDHVPIEGIKKAMIVVEKP
jgi:hypothetical protein